MEGYITALEESVYEITEKRSRFIATLRHCENEEAAASFLSEMRARYWDARHNVFAYSVSGGAFKRFSDDGEPHGTAGKPVLDVVEGSGMTDIAIVVTRYFGGVLLGTGGLVRAYSAAAKGAADQAERVRMTPCAVYKVTCPYADHDRLLHLIENAGGRVEDTAFAEVITLQFYLEDAAAAGMEAKLRETFSARLTAERLEERLLPVKTEDRP